MTVLAELFRSGSRHGRSIENPAVSLNDPAAYDYLTDGTKSSTGMSVTPRSALSCSEFWRGINLISRDVAKTPLLVYKRTGDNARERDRTHPAYRLLRRKPNRYTKAFDFKQTLQSHVLMAGNGYAYVFRNGAGDAVDLLQLNPYATYPVRQGGELFYVTHVGATNVMVDEEGKASGPVGEPRRLKAEDVLHIKGLGFDGLVGYDVITFARESLGLALGLRKYSSVFFRNGAHLGVVLEHPHALRQEAADMLRRSWETMHTGLENAHKTAILEEGMKAHVLSLDARKAQLMEVRQFEARAIANFIGIPPYLLGDDNQQAYASLEQRSQDYLDQSIDPWYCQWEEECTDKLLTEEQKENESHFIEFLREALVRVDYKTQREGLALEVNNGLANVDEARAILNRPPLPGGTGAKFRMPSNHQLIGESEEPAPEPVNPPQLPAPDAPADDRSVRALEGAKAMLADAWRRMDTRIAKHADRAAKKPGEFVAWVDSLERDHAGVVLEAVGPAIRMVSILSGYADLSKELVNAYFVRTRAELLKVAECKPSELVERVQAWANKWK